jgi:hypothetical protein
MRDRTGKPPKRPRDINQIAFQIVQEATGQTPPRPEEPEDPVKAAAAVLGRIGGLKGGKARSESMTPEARRESAKKAAEARWSRKETGPR